MDTAGSCSAHLIALLYETMGVMPGALAGERAVLPSSFAFPEKGRSQFTSTAVKLTKAFSLSRHERVVVGHA